MGLTIEGFTASVIIGMMLAIIYSLRMLYIIERRIMRMEGNIEQMTSKVLEEEAVIEKKILKKKR